jgi:taurine dioxygenase
MTVTEQLPSPAGAGSLSITPLGGTFAAEVGGLDLARPLGDRTVLDLHHALAEHKLLVFRGQHLSPTELVALGRQLGDLTAAHPVLPPLDEDHPEVLEIDATRSRQDPRYRDEYENDTWHTDVSFMPDPPLGSILSGVVVPERGGDTAFADLQAAYDTLSAPIRRLVNGLDAEHDGRAEFARFLAEHPEGGTWAGRRFTVLEPVRHPVVRAHPVTTRPGLFVNPTFTTRLVGLSRTESRALLELLYQHIVQPERTFRHHWQAGDIVMWDNRATLHVGVRDFGDAHRVLHRVTLAGGVPYRPVRLTSI